MTAAADDRSHSLVRPREVARSVTPLELFFDLVYVFTVSQLAHHLLDHVDARGMAETMVLTLAVMYAWFMTVWTSNWLDADRQPVRLLLLCLMFADPGGSTSFNISLLIFGGPAIFLLAQSAFMRVATGHLPRPRILACAALLVLALATAPFSLVVAVTAASAVLVGVAVDDARAESGSATPDMAAP